MPTDGLFHSKCLGINLRLEAGEARLAEIKDRLLDHRGLGQHLADRLLVASLFFLGPAQSIKPRLARHIIPMKLEQFPV